MHGNFFFSDEDNLILPATADRVDRWWWSFINNKRRDKMKNTARWRWAHSPMRLLLTVSWVGTKSFGECGMPEFIRSVLFSIFYWIWCANRHRGKLSSHDRQRPNGMSLIRLWFVCLCDVIFVCVGWSSWSKWLSGWRLQTFWFTNEWNLRNLLTHAWARSYRQSNEKTIKYWTHTLTHSAYEIT